MQAEPVAFENEASFYMGAQDSLAKGEVNQELEDELDRLMRLEHEQDEADNWRQDTEIESVMFPEDPGPLKNLKTDVYPSEFTEFAIRIPTKGDLSPFSFEGRRYLKEPYDTAARRVLLKCGRQTEKCVNENAHLALHDGSTRPIKDIEVGDRVVSLSEDGSHTTVGTVTWKSERYKKPCLRIKTKQNLQADVATTHPMRVLGRWLEAGELRPKQRIASLRQGGEFVGSTSLPDDHVKFAAFMLGDGCCGVSNNHNFTKSPGPVLDEFLELCSHLGWGTREVDRGGTISVNLSRLSAEGSPRRLLEQWGLWERRSGEKELPVWVWGLDRRQSALFLNRLWSTDGSVKQRSRSRYEVVYSSTSQVLIKGVQRLLWKFGIPSRVRENKPALYVGTDKVGYILYIQTSEGIRAFLTAIGALGKSEGIPLPSAAPNSNRDTYPIEVQGNIKRIVESRGNGGRYGRFATHSFHSAGLHETLPYPPSRRKLREYVDFFREDDRYDQDLVDQLAGHVDTDLYWDRIDTIEDLGEQWCYDISVDAGESFVIDGLVTHNSTMLGNRSLAYCGINANFKVLYVSATATQATVFSVDRLKEPIDISPELSYLLDSRLSQNVLFKQFKNRSQIRIRYAFLHADRVRGIPSDAILIDEIQDIVYKNVPIIEQCASHSDWKLFTYSGTPKSLDNTIEIYWAEHSTQNEWVVPCEHHGVPKRPDTWYWNILGARNIGKHGPVCAKCKKPLDPMHPHAQWAAMQPVSEENVDRVAFEGFRVNQLMVPWIVNDEDAWFESVIFPYENYDKAQFNNEILGLSFDSGQRPLTKHQVKACCQDGIRMYSEGLLQEYARRCHGGVAAGLDHGTGERESYSVLTLGGYMGGEFQIFFAHRFVGEELDPRVQLLKIAKILQEVNFFILGSDYGGGFDRNDWLMRNFGPQKVMKYQYASGPKKKIKWERDLGRFMLHRTEVMSDVFNAIRNRKIWLPNYEDFRTPHGSDMLNIFSEYNQQIHMTQYKVSPGKSDDTFHSVLYCFLASMFIRPRPDILVPIRPNDIDFTPDMAN